MTRGRSASAPGRRERGWTGLVLCMAVATNACAGAVRVAPRDALGVTEGQAPSPAGSAQAASPAGSAAQAGVAVAPPAAATSAPPADEPMTLPAATPPSTEPMPQPPAGYDKALEGSGGAPDPHRTRRIWGYAGIAIGGAAAVLAGVTSFMLIHQKSVLDDNCNAQKLCNATGLAETGAVVQTVPINNVAWVVAAVGLIGGGIVLLTSQPESSKDSGKSTALTVAPNAGGASVGLRSTF
jgi:hypothetical protein